MFGHNVPFTLRYYLAKYSAKYIVQKPGGEQSPRLALSGNPRDRRNGD
jgi:hypothetical protein